MDPRSLREERPVETDSGEETNDVTSSSAEEEDAGDADEPSRVVATEPTRSHSSPPIQVAPQGSASTGADTSLREEKSANLELLQSLFGGRDEWHGSDSLDSDIEMDVAEEKKARQVSPGAVSVDDFEVVPLEKEPSLAAKEKEVVVTSTAQSVDKHPPPVPSTSQPVKLKDLFAPREEEGTYNHYVIEREVTRNSLFDRLFSPWTSRS